MQIEKITLDTEKIAIKYIHEDAENSFKRKKTPPDSFVNAWKKLVDVFCNKFDYSEYTKVMPTDVIFKNKDEYNQTKVSFKLSVFEGVDREYKIQTPEYEYIGGRINNLDKDTNELLRDKHEYRHIYLNSQEIDTVNEVVEEAEKYISVNRKAEASQYTFDYNLELKEAS